MSRTKLRSVWTVKRHDRDAQEIKYVDYGSDVNRTYIVYCCLHGDRSRVVGM